MLYQYQGTGFVPAHSRLVAAFHATTNSTPVRGTVRRSTPGYFETACHRTFPAAAVPNAEVGLRLRALWTIRVL